MPRAGLEPLKASWHNDRLRVLMRVGMLRMMPFTREFWYIFRSALQVTRRFQSRRHDVPRRPGAPESRLADDRLGVRRRCGLLGMMPCSLEFPVDLRSVRQITRRFQNRRHDVPRQPEASNSLLAGDRRPAYLLSSQTLGSTLIPGRSTWFGSSPSLNRMRIGNRWTTFT